MPEIVAERCYSKAFERVLGLFQECSESRGANGCDGCPVEQLCNLFYDEYVCEEFKVDYTKEEKEYLATIRRGVKGIHKEAEERGVMSEEDKRTLTLLRKKEEGFRGNALAKKSIEYTSKIKETLEELKHEQIGTDRPVAI